MGRNAQRRRVEKAASKAAAPASVRASRSTRATARLRSRMLEIATLAQFEQMIQSAHRDRQGELRKLLTPMLRLGLPCCGQGALAVRTQQPILAGQHSLYCPTRNRVELVDA